MCLVILSNNKYMLYNFNTFNKREFKHDINDITKLNYINDGHYIYDNKLCILTKNKLFNNIKNENDLQIMLKSSISEKYEHISKQLLISRCEFFKNIFDVYNEEIVEFKNEYFENIDVYSKYIKNDEIIEPIKLLDICLYLGDVDIEHILNYIANIFSKQNDEFKNIHLYLSKLTDFPKYMNILIENYLKNIFIEEYKKFISECDVNILRYILNYKSELLIN